MQNVFRWIGLAMILIAAVMLLAGCSDGGGANSDELRRLAGTNMPQPAQAQQPTPLPRPTETPDFGNAQPALVAPPPAPQIVEVTRETVREVPVVQTVEVPVIHESVREMVVTATPRPQDCPPSVVMPLNHADIDAGVVMRGAMTECAYATAQAAGVLP